MMRKIQAKYGLTDYQTRLLKYYITVFLGETVKLLAIGFLFPHRYATYLWCVLLLATVHTATGGAHCRTYLGCLAASAAFFVLCIDVLSFIALPLPCRILLLAVCSIVNCRIGPVMTKERQRRFRDEDALVKSKRSALFRILAVTVCFILYSSFYPESAVAKAGFWVVLLDTAQLAAAKIINLVRKEG